MPAPDARRGFTLLELVIALAILAMIAGSVALGIRLAVGEETGRLEEMLTSVADTYEDQARRSLKNFLTILEPVVILGMGLLVGFIAFSMFLAIFRLNEVPF